MTQVKNELASTNFLFRTETANRKTRLGTLRVPRPPLGIYASSAVFFSKYAINPESGSSFLFPITPAGRISIVSARFGLVIT